MHIRVEDTGPCRKKLFIEAGAEDVAEDFVAVVRAVRAAAKPPGFRPGKAPESVIRTRYARQIEEELKERAVPRLFHLAVEREKLQPLAVVSAEEVRLDGNGGLSFTASVDVPPVFDLPTYRKLPLKAVGIEVPDERVDQEIERVLDSRAVYRDVADRGLAMGDMVMLEYAGTIDGQPVAKLAPQLPALNKGENFWTLVDERGFVPGLMDGLIGARPGETREVEVRFPGDFHVADLTDRVATYRVTVRGIRSKDRPPLDDEFLKRLGVESEQALRRTIRERLCEAARRRELNLLAEQAARHLLEHTEMDLPQAVVDREILLTARGLVQRIAARGATKDQIEQHRDTIVGEATKSARDRVKLNFILNRIAAEESITVEEDDLERRIEDLAREARMAPARLRAELEKKDSLDNLRGEIRAEKAMEWIVGNANRTA